MHCAEPDDGIPACVADCDWSTGCPTVADCDTAGCPEEGEPSKAQIDAYIAAGCAAEGTGPKCEDHDVSDGGTDSKKACCDTADCGVFYTNHGKPEEGGNCMVAAEQASATDACNDVTDVCKDVNPDAKVSAT
jgi:hypothetical protein